MKNIFRNSIVQRLIESLVAFVVMAAILFLMFREESPIERWPEVKKKTLTSISVDDIVSFKIHSDKAYAKDYFSAREFFKEGERNQFVVTFFEAIVDSQYYHPQHDVAIDQWGVQVRTKGSTLRIGFYIPDIHPDVVVGIIDSGSQEWCFQSQKLYQWYLKYNHRWLEPAEEHDTKGEEQERMRNEGMRLDHEDGGRVVFRLV